MRIAAWLFLLVVSLNAALAQTDTTGGIPVVVDGNVLFHIRQGMRGFPAETRAAQISQRIEQAVNDFSVVPDSIVAIDVEVATNIVAGDQFLMLVLDTDAEHTGKSRQELGAEYATIIKRAIETGRDARHPTTLVRGVLWSIFATVVFLVGLFLLRKITDKILVLLRGRIHTIKIGAQEVIQASWIESLLYGATKLVRIIILGVGIYFYLASVLGNFVWTWSIAQRLFELVLNPLKTLGQDIVDELPNLIFLAVIFILMKYVIRSVRFFFLEIEKGAVKLTNFYADWAMPTYKIVRMLIIILAAVIAFPYIPGSKSAAFQGISIFLGLLLSLGSSSAVASVVAGTILTYMRAFKIGDMVQIGDARGVVVETSLFVTRLRTPKNVEVAIPNSSILSSQVVNYSTQAKEGKLILPATVSIGYDAPWRQIHAMLQLAAERTEGILKDPRPYVLQLMLDDFYVKYELNVYVDSALNMLAAYSELHKNIQDVFNEHGVQIMSPHFEADKSEPVVVPKERWHAPPADKRDPG
jgi:small-conductance mechanosensitive channel